MSDLTLESLVRAWEMLVDQYLIALEELGAPINPAYAALEKKVFRKLLIASIRPPEFTPFNVVSALSTYCFSEMQKITQQYEGEPQVNLVEIRTRALKTVIGLGRVLPRFLDTQEFGFEDLRIVQTELAIRLPPPLQFGTESLKVKTPTTRPAPSPDKQLLNECRGSSPPTQPPPVDADPEPPRLVSSTYMQLLKGSKR